MSGLAWIIVSVWRWVAIGFRTSCAWHHTLSLSYLWRVSRSARPSSPKGASHSCYGHRFRLIATRVEEAKGREFSQSISSQVERVGGVGTGVGGGSPTRSH